MPLNAEEKKKIFGNFGQSAQDTGSAAVQVAMLTERIKQLTGHLKNNYHDFASKRGLLKMVAKRRKFLRYLEEKDNATYKKTIERLGLKK
ncbi:30S ribosomal protein S15 [Candidatus Dependentiae bacterium]|nr:30S ribosomal protein S15 [Bacteroidota bacterium]NRB21488.1 30S ribosomal protein S15 [Candidatus Dependentiae bacterium]